MFRLKHDNSKKVDVEALIQADSAQQSRAWQLGGWLWHAFSRRCKAGLWTMTRDGKLNCESWCSDACRHE